MTILLSIIIIICYKSVVWTMNSLVCYLNAFMEEKNNKIRAYHPKVMRNILIYAQVANTNAPIFSRWKKKSVASPTRSSLVL